MLDLIPLSHLEPGNTAEVGHLNGDPGEVQRLQELGLRLGAVVEMVQAGDPCIVQVFGSRLCFRPSDSFSVFVRDGVTA